MLIAVIKISGKSVVLVAGEGLNPQPGLEHL